MADLSALAQGILRKTNEGKIHWEEYAATTFMASIGDFSVLVGFDSSGHWLSINNEDGRTIETGVGTSWDNSIELLYEKARRQALKVDQAIDQLQKVVSSL